MALALGLLLGLLIFRALAFNLRRFDNSGGTANFNRGDTESDSASDSAESAGVGDVGDVTH
jgi:hypothetical protein